MKMTRFWLRLTILQYVPLVMSVLCVNGSVTLSSRQQVVIPFMQTSLWTFWSLQVCHVKIGHQCIHPLFLITSSHFCIKERFQFCWSIGLLLILAYRYINDWVSWIYTQGISAKYVLICAVRKWLKKWVYSYCRLKNSLCLNESKG